jgi:hypothetical protein
MTLLTLFLGDKPTATLPPEPAPTTTAVLYEEAFETASADDPFGLPLITTPARSTSPSLLVAAPPKGYDASFDVFSPAVRPPHEFPTLYPCDAVALVPCPPPLPALDPPAVRHVSFTGEGGEYRLAACENACETQACPPGAVFTHRVFGHALPALGLWEQLHARQHASEYHDPASPCEAGPICPLTGTPGICPLAGAPAICPLGFGGPLHAPAFVVAAQNENHPGCPVNLPAHPFPGAKNVQHVVSATYDVPHETAKTVAQLLETGHGVQICSINGDELTVNATPQAQMAIAQFLAVVTEPNEASRAARTISVHHTEAKACPTECTEAKACTTECSAAKCCSECGEKCACCKCGKKEAATAIQALLNSPKAKSIEYHLGLTDCKPCPPAADNALDKKLFSFYVGLSDCKACPPAATQPIAIQVQATEVKPVIVKIQATPDGVLLQTSDGTQVRAESIQLETHGVNRLQVEHAQSVHTQPKPAPKPPTATSTDKIGFPSLPMISMVFIARDLFRQSEV